MRYLLIVAGVLLMAWAFAFDASVPVYEVAVINLGLVAEKLMVFSLGAVLFLAGVILVAAQRVAHAVRGSSERIEPSADTSEPVSRPSYVVGPGLKPARRA